MGNSSGRILALMLTVGSGAALAKKIYAANAVTLAEELGSPAPAGECFCNRDLTLEECTEIIEKLRDSESAVKSASGYSLFAASNCNLPAGDKSIAKFHGKINEIFTKYDVTSCIRKIHFLAQVYHETDRFRTTKEYSTSGDYSPYFGRGLMQLTHEEAYIRYEAYSGVDCVENYEQIAEDLHNAFDSAGWYWKLGKKLTVGERWTSHSGSPSYVRVHSPNYPKTTIEYTYNGSTRKYGTVDLNLIADNDTVDVISYLVNGGSNGLHERRNYINTLKRIFKYPQTCVDEGGTADEGDSETAGVTIRLTRKWQTNVSTIGEFTIDDTEISGFMLEEKGPDTTTSGLEQRVPVGTYNLEWHSGAKFSKALKLFNSQVAKSRAILIHAGNSAADTEGCLLPGSSRSVDWVSSSRVKLNEIFDVVEERGIEGATIVITAAYE